MGDIMNPFTNSILQGVKRNRLFEPTGPIEATGIMGESHDMMNRFRSPLGPIDPNIFRTPPIFGTKTPLVIDESGAFGRRPDYNAEEGRIGKASPMLFGQGAKEALANRPQVVSEEDPYDGTYRPETKYTEMYGKGIDEMPQRNKPGIWRRIGASIIGAGGGDAQAALYAPYNRQLADWKEKMAAIQPAMTNERQSNQIERQASSDEARARIADRREDTRIRDLERKERTDAENIKIRQDRVTIAEYKAKNPAHRYFEDESGNLVAVNPVTNKPEYVIGPEGPINTGKLSEAEKINLDIQGRIKVARVQGEEARKTENTRSANDSREIKERGEQARETKTTPANEGQEQVTETTVAVTDAEGKPQGQRTTRQTRTTTKPGNNVKFKDPKTGKTYNIPKTDKNAIAEAQKRKYQEVK